VDGSGVVEDAGIGVIVPAGPAVGVDVPAGEQAETSRMTRTRIDLIFLAIYLTSRSNIEIYLPNGWAHLLTIIAPFLKNRAACPLGAAGGASGGAGVWRLILFLTA